jgi:hypothetical protein
MERAQPSVPTQRDDAGSSEREQADLEALAERVYRLLQAECRLERARRGDPEPGGR